MKPNTDYEKRELLIQAAKKEFLEKGYSKASLRSICAKAGMTTGALYFFFENKEDLYDEITGSAKQKLMWLIQNHIEEDKDAVQHVTDVNELFFDHSSEADMFIECIYNDYDSFMLILSGSKEGEMEKCVDEFVKLTEESSTDFMNAVPSIKPDPFMSHWIAHTIVDSFVHVIQHEKDMEKAKIRMRMILNFIVRGWTSLLIPETTQPKMTQPKQQAGQSSSKGRAAKTKQAAAATVRAAGKKKSEK